MKKKSFLVAAIAILFLCQFTPLWTQDEMELEFIWEIQYQGGSQANEQVCKKGKYIVNSSDGERYLYDLNTGELIYKTTKGIESSLVVNDEGDKFYIRNLTENTFEEYDIKTKALIQKLPHVINGFMYPKRISHDNAYHEFYDHPHSFVFKDLYTGTVLDSFKVPNSPDEATFRMVDQGEFSFDGRYFKFGLKNQFSSEAGTNWFVYDRQAKEIVFLRYIEPALGGELYLEFYNIKNWMFVSHRMKLNDDDIAYNYLSEFDLDTREFKNHIKINKLANFTSARLRLDDKMYTYRLIYPNGDSTNVTRFYDYENKRIIDYTMKHWINMFDSNNIWYWSSSLGLLRKYRFDWTVGVEDEINKIERILYPNPTSEYITITKPTEGFEPSEGSEIRIYNTLGVLVMSQQIHPMTTSHQMNVEHLPRGVYYLRMGSRTQMFVKM
ncbi:MAG: T9SS type A sorting domain-containing protein [Desulfobulbaceae bacterium]|nr:T9SS type A sorting domain-containing protein [Desulfobulbaceae bacterium]